MDANKALFGQQLNSSTVEKLQSAAYQPWTQGTQRTLITDLITLEDGHIIINKNSNKKLGTGTICVFEHGAKQGIYGAFDLMLEKYISAVPGEYELESNPDKAYDTKACLYKKVEGVWMAFRRIDGNYVAMDLPEDTQAAEAMRLRLSWLDLVIKGAYIDINVNEYAPQLCNYFGSLLGMTPMEAAQTIDCHIANKRERRITWTAAQTEAVTPVDVFKVDTEDVGTDALKALKKIFVKKGERVFTAGTSSAAELSNLTYLLQHGYTLSRQA
jgi:hypothetical protein